MAGSKGLAHGNTEVRRPQLDFHFGFSALVQFTTVMMD
jgi:hypothetical protein